MSQVQPQLVVIYISVCVQIKQTRYVLFGKNIFIFFLCLFNRDKYGMHRNLHNNSQIQCITTFITTVNFQCTHTHILYTVYCTTLAFKNPFSSILKC